MLRNYVKLAYRNLLRQRASSFINIVGLSVAIGCSVLVYLFMDMHVSMDAFHEHADRIFLVENIIDRDGQRQTWGDSPRPLGPAMEAGLPQVERAVRVGYGSSDVQYGDRVFREGLWFVDPGFLAMFDFPLKYGKAATLADENTLVLSEQAAIKYFGEANPVGEEVTLTFGDDRVEAFVVGGVAERIPEAASFEFNILLSYQKLRDLDQDLDDWGQYTGATFIQLRDPNDLDAVAAQMDRYIALQNAASTKWPIAAFTFDNLRSLARHSHLVRGDISDGTHPAAPVTLPIIAAFLLVLSCFNYVNIAIASAARRMKEIGVRKVVGSNRLQLVGQFLTENLLLCLLALVLGVALAKFFLVPSFNGFFEGWPLLSVSLTQDLGLWGFLLALLALTGLASGAYPAFYIASFQPVAILRGRQAVGGKKRFTQSLLAFQFVLAFITMIGGVVLLQNSQYQNQRDWGYDQEHTLILPLKEASQADVLENALRQHPNVMHVAKSRHQFGRSTGYDVVEVQGEEYETTRFDVGYGYAETLGLGIEEGRFFDQNQPGDATRAVVVNETFAERLGWADPVGRQIRMDSTAYTVVGVAEDFHYNAFFDPIGPAVLRVADPATYRFVSVRVQAGTGVQTAQEVEALWKQLFPDVPYNGIFQDDAFDWFYRASGNITNIFAFTALMALLISCMGLFGLASQTILQRMKEISIRKVLGASVLHVTGLVGRRFVLLLIATCIVAAPLSYFMIEALLDSIFAYHVAIGPLPFALAFVLVAVTALLTIARQVYKVATANPAEVLRTE